MAKQVSLYTNKDMNVTDVSLSQSECKTYVNKCVYLKASWWHTEYIPVVD